MTQQKINSNYGTIIIQDFKIIEVDDIYAHIYGYESAADLKAHTTSFFDFISPAYKYVARDNYNKLISGEIKPKGTTYTNVDRNGKQFTVFTLENIVERNGRKAVQIFVVDLSIIDSTHQHILNRGLMYEKMIISSAQAILIHRNNFQPILANRSFIKMLQIPKEKDLSQTPNFYDLFIPDKKTKNNIFKRYENILTQHLKGDVYEAPITTYNGDQRVYKIYSDCVDWDGGPAIYSVFEDITKQIQLQKKLREQALTDELTGVYNRRAGQIALTKSMTNSLRYKHQVSIILIDLDLFKNINDTYGHNIGDKFLIHFTQLLTDNVRSVDFIIRYGGDEFNIVLPNTDEKQCQIVMNKLKSALAEAPFVYGKIKIPVRVSMGVATWDNQESLNSLMDRADKRLYEEKEKHHVIN